jgi:uncharacterized protein (TIGR00251 family)
MGWMTVTKEGVVLTLKATPRASKTEFAGADADWLRVRLQAPPVDGKANAALAEFLAESLGLPKRSVRVVAGETARVKRVLLEGTTPSAILGKLGIKQ